MYIATLECNTTSAESIYTHDHVESCGQVGGVEKVEDHRQRLHDDGLLIYHEYTKILERD